MAKRCCNCLLTNTIFNDHRYMNVYTLIYGNHPAGKEPFELERVFSIFWRSMFGQWNGQKLRWGSKCASSHLKNVEISIHTQHVWCQKTRGVKTLCWIEHQEVFLANIGFSKILVYWNLFVLVHAASKPLQNIPDPNILAIVWLYVRILLWYRFDLDMMILFLVGFKYFVESNLWCFVVYWGSCF